MELPRIKKSEHVGGMLDSIKSKLGFADARANDYDEGYYDEDYSEEYGDGAYDDDFEAYAPGQDNAPSSRYEPYAPVSTRPARAGRSSSRMAQTSDDADFPKLVSIDDVRANTQIPRSLNRDPLPARRVTTPVPGGYRGERTVVDVTMPAPSSPAHTAARRERSEGYNSLFEPSATDDKPAVNALLGSANAQASANRDAIAKPTGATASSAASSGLDPYAPYAGATSPNPSRSLSVLKPSSYGEVERIASILKKGDAVVLSLRNTPDSLSKRILDFSFGVSSALDASVECVSDKVFAITQGIALTEAERIALRNQGVL